MNTPWKELIPHRPSIFTTHHHQVGTFANSFLYFHNSPFPPALLHLPPFNTHPPPNNILQWSPHLQQIPKSRTNAAHLPQHLCVSTWVRNFFSLQHKRQHKVQVNYPPARNTTPWSIIKRQQSQPKVFNRIYIHVEHHNNQLWSNSKNPNRRRAFKSLIICYPTIISPMNSIK